MASTSVVGHKRAREDAPSLDKALVHMALTGPLGEFWTDFYTPAVLRSRAVRQWKSNMVASHEDDFATLGAPLYNEWSCCVKVGKIKVGCFAYLSALVYQHEPQRDKVTLELQIDAGRHARKAISTPVDVVVPFEKTHSYGNAPYGRCKKQMRDSTAQELLSLPEYKKAFCRLAPQLHRYFSKLSRCPGCNKVFVEYTAKDGRCTNCHWAP